MNTKTVTLTIVLTAPFTATEDEIETEAVLSLESGALHVEFISVAEGITVHAQELGAEASYFTGEFRALQHKVYAAMLEVHSNPRWWRTDASGWRETLAGGRHGDFSKVDPDELTHAIRYSIDHGRMP